MGNAPQLGKAVLITGTDLGVGKTFVAAGLARILRDRGFDVGVMKPVEVGWPKDAGEWPIDADTLRRAANSDDPIEDVVPYIFEDMLAPQVAADRAAEPIEFDRIMESLNRLREKHDIVLVEGTGGLAVPLDDGLNLATLAKHCGLSVLVVALAHVGTLNHTFLTVQYAKSEGLEVLGIVVNMLDETIEDASTPSNPPMMKRMCKVPVFGVVPLQENADTLDEAIAICDKCFDIDALLNSIGLAATSEN